MNVYQIFMYNLSDLLKSGNFRGLEQFSFEFGEFWARLTGNGGSSIAVYDQCQSV